MVYVYILRCYTGNLYTGIAKNLKIRMQQHKNGAGSKYVKNNIFKELVYYEDCGDGLSRARLRENQIKNFTRVHKENLIKSISSNKLTQRAIKEINEVLI